MSAAMEQAERELAQARADEAAAQESQSQAESAMAQAAEEFEAASRAAAKKFEDGDKSAEFPNSSQHEAQQKVRAATIQKLTSRTKSAAGVVRDKEEKLRLAKVATIDEGEPEDFQAVHVALADLRDGLCRSIARRRVKERNLEAGERHWVTYIDRYGPAMKVLDQLVRLDWPKELSPDWLVRNPGFGWVPYHLPQVAAAETEFREALRSGGDA